MVAKAYKVLLEDACASKADIDLDHPTESFDNAAKELALLLHNGVPSKAVDVLFQKIADCLGIEDGETFCQDAEKAISFIGDGYV